ncbi:MAG: glycosyltransferase family 1 protein [Clostridia bacterium]|nr:glycosyltransferase family 1 protein [Clostridia bacterium]
MIRILHITGTMNMGGQETFIMNLYRNIDRKKIQFDFVIHSNEKNFFEEEIKKLGGKIYRISPISKNPIKHCIQLYKIIKENKYEIIHRHTNSSIVFMDMIIAKIAHAQKRIIHSHSSIGNYKFLHYIFRFLLNQFSNTKLACSDIAGKWLYGSKKEFVIVPNSIEVDKFKFDISNRKRIRQHYNIDGKTLLIGYVGAFRYQKNHCWLIEMFSKYKMENANAKLMLCGDGELKKEIEKKIESLGLKEDVILTGNVNSEEYYSAFDVFVLPSIHEGLGIVLIEAQISNLPCLVSTAIQDEAIISDNLNKIELNEQKWIDELKKYVIQENREDLECFKYNKYNINSLVQIMYDIYSIKN